MERAAIPDSEPRYTELNPVRGGSLVSTGTWMAMRWGPMVLVFWGLFVCAGARSSPRLHPYGISNGEPPNIRLSIFEVWSSPLPPSRIPLQTWGSLPMNRFLLLSLLASAGAWILIRTSSSQNRVVPVAEAAAKLQQAWADHHTTV